MYSHTTRIRVRYADTDQMGYVYYGRYTEYLEVARTEAMRDLDEPYGELEKMGVALPVLDLHIKYIRPAHYDDQLILNTTITELPGGRITFLTDIERDDGQLLTKGRVTLCFVDAKTGRPTRPPEDLINKLKPYFE